MLEELFKQTESVFNDIATAERMIDKFSKKYPEHKEVLNESFILFMRSKYITSDNLYEKHCYELARCICNSGDTTLPTDAELLSMTSDTSLQVKFNPDGILVFDRLYEKVIGITSPVHDTYREDYPGHIDKIIHDLKNKYKIIDRKIQKTVDS